MTFGTFSSLLDIIVEKSKEKLDEMFHYFTYFTFERQQDCETELLG